MKIYSLFLNKYCYDFFVFVCSSGHKADIFFYRSVNFYFKCNMQAKQIKKEREQKKTVIMNVASVFVFVVKEN